MNMDNYDFTELVDALLNGGVVVMPTDTVYGLVCSALNLSAVKRMYEIKQRSGKPGTIIAGSLQQLLNMRFNNTEINTASQFWPGTVSVILRASDNLDYLHMGKESLAVRIPDIEWLRALLIQAGPLATTSANLPGEPTVTSAEQARNIFDDKVELYIDGGKITNGKPSKIVRILPSGETETIRD